MIEVAYTNPWLYNGQPFESHDIGKNFGFVYCITNQLDGRKYIGRKYFWFIRKTAKSKRRTRTESDWKQYYGSNSVLLKDVEKFGFVNFSREILSLHQTKGGVNYTEIEEQFKRRVVTSSEYYNESINGKYKNIRLDLSVYAISQTNK